MHLAIESLLTLQFAWQPSHLGGTVMADYYPDSPGAKGLTAPASASSKDAAKAIAPHRIRLHNIALHTLATFGEAAPFEAVKAAGVKASALQPRFSELIAEGLVEPTGERRCNPDTGKTAAVLRLTELARERLAGGAQ